MKPVRDARKMLPAEGILCLASNKSLMEHGLRSL
jgi:hypothetical protein